MDVLYLLQFLDFAHSIASYTPQFCQEAVNTIKQVPSCPITQQDRENAAKEKDCEKYSHHQNCSKATDFMYHCVINENENKLLEVCAPTRYILGFCTEFNVIGGRIQDHYSAECSTFNPPCPGRYISTDAYLYKSCYGLVETSEESYVANMTSTTIGSNNVTSIHGDSTDSILSYEIDHCSLSLPFIKQFLFQNTIIWLLPVVVASLVLALALVLWICWKKRQSKRQRMYMEVRKGWQTDKITESSPLIPHEQTGTDLVDKNKEHTKDFLEPFRNFDKYFVETEIFKTMKAVIEEHHVAILIGPPGHGKTNTAIHLMLHSSFADWTMRKINRLSELASIDTTENTFVLIDNIFDGYVYDEEVAKWRDSLGFKFVNLAKEKNVQVLITAKEDVIEKVCKYMNNKSNVFDQKHVIDVKNVQLTDSEKIDIFDNQISFANKELRIDKPAKNEKFRKEIVAAEGPIGFPLCAHLYACAEKNRRMGSNFFSHPMNYLRDLVKHAISEDQTHKTKTLLLLLYLPESCPKYPSSKTMNLLDEKMCQQTLETFLNENKEFDTSDLATQAKKLIPTILMQLQPGSFCFKHQTICNAVGNYFFVEHFEMAREAFPIETFVDQDFSTITEKQCSAICARLIREVVENGNVSKVFSCIALTESSFAHIFCLQLDAQFDKHGVSFIRQFFAATGTPSCQFKFPGTFWVSKNKCFHLAMLMTEMIRKKNIDTDLHFYASLFGDCCASDESLLKHANNTTLEDVENAKDAVLRCITCDGNNIFHIVAMTAKSDLHSCRSLKKLYADFQDRQPEMYSKANKREETPLNLTATIKSDSRILSILTFLEFDETCTNTKDIDGHYPIHNTALTLKSSIYNALFELEMTVRLCLFIVYGTNSDHQAEAKSLLDNQRFKHFYAMLEGKSEKQNEMASIIEQLLTEIKNEKTDTEEGDTEVPNPNKRINHSLFSMIQISVSFLVNAKFEI